MVRTMVRTYYNVMSQLLIGKGHTCAPCTRTTCFGRIHGSQLSEGANAGQHTPTLSLPPSHHCLNGEVYRGNRHYVCEHVGLDTNQGLHHPLSETSWGDGYTCTSRFETMLFVHVYVHMYVHVYVSVSESCDITLLYS
jgi:hypothetical protein